MNSNIRFLGVLFLLFSLKSVAQVSVDGEFRPRTEFRSGFQKPLADSLKPAFLTAQRTRLSFDYKSENLNAKLTFQDSRIWGKTNTNDNNIKLGIYEAWAEYLICSGLSAQFGRVAIRYDDQRLLGISNWSNTGNAHDLLLLKYNPSNSWQAHMGLAYNNSADTLMEINYKLTKMYKSMGFLWLSKTFNKGYSVTAIGITEGLQKTNDYTVIYPRFTFGGNFSYKNDSSKLGVYVTGYLQKGKNYAFKDLNAFLVAFKLSYKIYKQSTIIAGLDYFSGTKPDTIASESNTFEKLYGTNHSFNGSMEYWRNPTSSGLIDFYLGASGKLSKKLSLDLTCHSFRMAEKYLIGTTEIDKNLGAEIDLIANYTISKEILFQAGYSKYFNSSSTKDYFKMSGIETRTSQWMFLMITIKPNFYKTPVLEPK